ncbi:hypothetical protein CcI49_26785 [Frankia sp. CcI49]|uniref:effector-associated domain EAD1-containing protein n=1 Tax=Frankia sp. CcI49 TaxID=1745382 RepID=UPI000978964F|nr:effector-associated domain EAD1-containing protein [Frankia sp. CcI49]ONH57034.1 hypothetical protein CcI49_26785 [Frankia sp. CcI49]
MVEGLSGEQVRALAEVFSDERSARSVLERAGFPAGRFPWGASNAVLTDTPAGEYAELLAEAPGRAVEDVWGRSVERLRVGVPAAAKLLEVCA